MNKYYIILVFLCLFTFSALQAQRMKRFGFAYRHGWVLKHHEELRQAFPGTHPFGVEFTYLSKTTGDEEWERVWNYPDVGVNLVYLNYDDVRLGHVLISTFFLQKYIGDPDNRFQLSFKVAPGISYSSRAYDAETNPDNTFISTRLNAIMEGNLLAHYRLNPHLTLNGGFTFTHYSNGAIQVPNSGFNIPTLTLGMIYSANPSNYTRNDEPISPFHRRNRLQLKFAPSVKSFDDKDPKQYFAYTLSVNGIRYLNHKVGLNAAVDLFYNASIPDRKKDPDANKYRIGLALGPELTTGKNSLLFQLGYYVYRPVEIDKSWYWRIGIKHHFTDHLFIGFALKAHMGKADVIEWGAGYRF
jgi:hypothetical protein